MTIRTCDACRGGGRLLEMSQTKPGVLDDVQCGGCGGSGLREDPKELVGRNQEMLLLLGDLVEAVAPGLDGNRCLVCGSNHVRGDDGDPSCIVSKALRWLEPLPKKGSA